MNLKKYLSKHVILRISLLIVLIGGAALFDMYHTGNQKLADSIRKLPLPKDIDSGKIYFCNPVNTINLKNPATALSVSFRFYSTQDKFILKYYNMRTFQLMKAETAQSLCTVARSYHSLPFNRVIYCSFDDTPPLS